MTQDAAPSHARPLGRTELRVFPIAYGLWRFAGTNVPTAGDKIQAALDAGITLFDIADVYGYDGKSGFGDAEDLFGRSRARRRCASACSSPPRAAWIRACRTTRASAT
jgi:aryl-alcohol dehydrogenase-like predicted oxidoreductase